ncbi:hypothetical protein AALA44_02770 [Enterococcus ratti]|uniref:hypothetical protein n=1 Tax=Enterococcus ratti TaxID=150033 RepID=UPI0035122F79
MIKENVLIYGLEKARWKYTKSLIKENPNIKKMPLFIDDYNDGVTWLLEKEIAQKKKEPSQKSCWDSTENFSEFIEKMPIMMKERLNFPLWSAYFSHFQNKSKNQLQKIYQFQLQEINKNQKNKFNVNNINTYLHVKRGCKIGLEMAKSIANLKIYFVLDGLDFKSVVFKDTKRFKKSYTGIELRYVYRNWEELKDKVVFIKQKKQVEAPWKQEPKLWDAYIPKSHQQKKECMLQKENDSKRLCSQVFFNEKIGNVKKKISHNLRKKSKNLENQKMINSLSIEGLKASEKEMITTKNDTTVKEKRRFVNLVKFTRNDSYHVAHVAKSSEKLKKEKVSCFSLASYSRD